jgi:CRP-like cAMP-binding protein
VLILRSFPGLAHLEPSELAVLADHAEERFYPRGSCVYREGEPVRELHYVIEGRVAVRRRGLVLTELSGLSVVGGLASLASVVNGQEVIALEDTTTLAVSKEVQTEVFEDNYSMLLAVLRAVADVLIETRHAAGPGGGINTSPENVVATAEPLTLVDKLNILRQTMTLGATRLEAIAELARGSRELRARKDAVLWKRGQPSGTTLVVVSGVVRARSGDQDLRFGPGDVAGSLDSLAGRPRWFDAECETDVVALEMDVELFLDVLEDNVDMAMGLLQVMADTVLTLRERIAEAGAGRGRDTAAVGFRDNDPPVD